MATENELRRIARDAAMQAQARIPHLEHEIFELEAQVAEKKAERDAARGAAKRLANLPVRSAGDYFCPYCWIENGIRSPIRSIGGGTNSDDFFRCSNGHGITVPF